jgi:hypothetical protein
MAVRWPALMTRIHGYRTEIKGNCIKENQK